jgi:hypothetical protein
MSSALAHELDSLGHQQDRLISRVRRTVKKKTDHALVMAMAECFLDADLALTPAAKKVLGHMGRLAGLGKARKGRSMEDIYFDEGARFIVLDMIDLLSLHFDTASVMAHQLREANDE